MNDDEIREIERRYQDEKKAHDPTPVTAEDIWGAEDVSPIGDKPTEDGDVSTITADLLDRVNEILSRFVAFPSRFACCACCAWVLHTWALDAFDSTPRLAALSPEKGSGKTRLLEVLELLVPTGKHTVNMSAAVLFRLVGGDEPVTLLMDEADTYLGWKVAREHEDIRGLVNAGHRRGATAYRMKMEGGAKVEEFPAFAAVALAGIGDLPDTIIDRCVVVAMKRRAPSEKIEQFRRRIVEPEIRPLVADLEAWAKGAGDRLMGVVEKMTFPPGIEDRPADVWEALIAIGDLAGGEWSQRLREAAVALNAERAERDPSLGIQLLSDIRELFELDGDVDRARSLDLVNLLTAIEGAPWSNIKGEPIDAHGVARRLKAYGIRPGTHRFEDGALRGYLRTDFYDAWERYLPPREARNIHNTHNETPPGVAPVAGVAASRGEDEGQREGLQA